jgi:hypothetical protein
VESPQNSAQPFRVSPWKFFVDRITRKSDQELDGAIILMHRRRPEHGRQSSQICKVVDFIRSRSPIFLDQRGPSADKIDKRPLESRRAGEHETRLKSQLLGVRGFSGEQD